MAIDNFLGLNTARQSSAVSWVFMVPGMKCATVQVQGWYTARLCCAGVYTNTRSSFFTSLIFTLGSNSHSILRSTQGSLCCFWSAAWPLSLFAKPVDTHVLIPLLPGPSSLSGLQRASASHGILWDMASRNCEFHKQRREYYFWALYNFCNKKHLNPSYQQHLHLQKLSSSSHIS